MYPPIAIIAISLFLGLASQAPGTPLSADLIYLALLCGLGGLLLLVFRRRGPVADYIALDGSNLLCWQDEKPNLGSIQLVVDALNRQGFSPVVWFDANAGYLIGDRWMGPEVLARQLGLSPRQVFVAPKGTPADPLLLDGARTLGARVVSNDRFRDWTDSRPWLGEPGFLIRGRIRDGIAQLELGQAPDADLGPKRRQDRVTRAG